MSNPFDFSDPPERQKKTEAWRPTNMLPPGEPVQTPAPLRRRPSAWGFCWPTPVRLLVYLALFLGVAGPSWAVWYFGWHRPAVLREKYEQRRLYEQYNGSLKAILTTPPGASPGEIGYWRQKMNEIDQESKQRWGRSVEDFQHLPPTASGYYGDQTR